MLETLKKGLFQKVLRPFGKDIDATKKSVAIVLTKSPEELINAYTFESFCDEPDKYSYLVRLKDSLPSISNLNLLSSFGKELLKGISLNPKIGSSLHIHGRNEMKTSVISWQRENTVVKYDTDNSLFFAFISNPYITEDIILNFVANDQSLSRESAYLIKALEMGNQELFKDLLGLFSRNSITHFFFNIKKIYYYDSNLLLNEGVNQILFDLINTITERDRQKFMEGFKDDYYLKEEGKIGIIKSSKKAEHFDFQDQYGHDFFDYYSFFMSHIIHLSQTKKDNNIHANREVLFSDNFEGSFISDEISGLKLDEYLLVHGLPKSIHDKRRVVFEKLLTKTILIDRYALLGDSMHQMINNPGNQDLDDQWEGDFHTIKEIAEKNGLDFTEIRELGGKKQEDAHISFDNTLQFVLKRHNVSHYNDVIANTSSRPVGFNFRDKIV